MVTGVYDTISVLLDEVGLEYDVYDGIYSTEYLDFLTDPGQMALYDVIFLNCGIDAELWTWLGQFDEVGDNLQSFVEWGGSLYASDWAYAFVEAAFPSAIDFYGDDTDIGTPCDGRWGSMSASVLDTWMQATIGSTEANIIYNLGGWCVPVAVGGSSYTMVEADVYLRSEEPVLDAPLAVRFDHGGTVIFTTFHNEAQASTDMVAALKEIILSL